MTPETVLQEGRVGVALEIGASPTSRRVLARTDPPGVSRVITKYLSNAELQKRRQGLFLGEEHPRGRDLGCGACQSDQQEPAKAQLQVRREHARG